MVLVGKGGSSSIYKMDLPDGVYALKELSLNLENSPSLYKLASKVQRIFREVIIIRRVSVSNHPHLLKYSGLALKVNDFNQLTIYLVSKFYETDLQRLALLSQGELGQERKICLLQEIVLGIKRLQELRVIHADLKPSNILIDRRGRAVIADYGTSRILRESNDTFESQTLHATIKYAPPELLFHSQLNFSVFFYFFWTNNFKIF